MNYNIRPYKSSDFSTIQCWWTAFNEPAPTEDMLSSQGSFILELNNIPVLNLTTYLTQCSGIAYVQGFIKNPNFKDINLEEYGQLLWNHCFNYAKEAGYKRVICFSVLDKLSNKYERFGMKKTASNVSSFVRIL